MKDECGNIYYEEIEELLKEQENKLKSIIGKEISDILAYSDDEFTQWYQPIIFVIEDTELVVKVYDLEKLVLKWNFDFEESYFIDEIKWGNESESFKKIINSKIVRIDIIEFDRKWETIYSKNNPNDIGNTNYSRDLIGIGIHTETGYIEICNGTDEANISFNYEEENGCTRTIIK